MRMWCSTRAYSRTVEFATRERERERGELGAYYTHARLKEARKKEDCGYDLTVVRQSCRAVHVTIKISPTSRKPLRESTYGRDPAEVVNLLLLPPRTCKRASLPPSFFSSKLFLTGGIKKFLGNNTIINTIERAHVLGATERLFYPKG